MISIVHPQATLLFPPNPAFATNPPTGGILLNPTRSRSPSVSPAPSHKLHHSSSSSSSDSTSTSLQQGSSDRKIRFAPLPDPRRVNDDNTPTSELPSVFLDDDDAKIDYFLSSSPDEKPPGSALPRTPGPPPLTPSSERRWSTKKLLRPFLSATPIKSTSNDERTSSQQALYRATSRESISENDAYGFPLARRKSTGSAPPPPLNQPAALRPAIASIPLRPTISADSQTNARRLLNGRTYGGSRSGRARGSQSAINTPAEEPEFVEWGYGGMGSVKSGEQAYSSVQKNSSALVDGDEEDASGMGWVRKRRAQRAREAMEKALLAQAESASSSSSSQTPPAITVNSPPISPSSESSPPTLAAPTKDAAHHIQVSVPIPTTAARPHYAHTYSGYSSGNSTPTNSRVHHLRVNGSSNSTATTSSLSTVTSGTSSGTSDSSSTTPSTRASRIKELHIDISSLANSHHSIGPFPPAASAVDSSPDQAPASSVSNTSDEDSERDDADEEDENGEDDDEDEELQTSSEKQVYVLVLKKSVGIGSKFSSLPSSVVVFHAIDTSKALLPVLVRD
ncbi:hypothetical protein SISSUDRAFT_1124360 [Sistotremastrum suecicum HHB10207 ss-3]|uniref:Uncharacterized protein n=1 Tax=Sistotremastrum suecicum HHB10207 ss-3 TaxID=1314776 RepID=A0A166IZW2_9AGAM|nr:hypothetical protein SISSUDRAFT_1124360 [Sistotremastrum suecicum HHB10207 ss-3]